MRANEFSSGYGFGFIRFVMEASSPDQLTAKMAGPMMLPVAKLLQYYNPVSKDEYRASQAQKQHDKVIVRVDYEGRPAIAQGMADLGVARDSGEQYIAAEVEWFGDSDQNKNGPFCPAAVTAMAKWD